MKQKRSNTYYTFEKKDIQGYKIYFLVCHSCQMIIINSLGLVYILSNIPLIRVSHSCTLSSLTSLPYDHFQVADCLFFNACATADPQEYAVVSV